MFTFRRSRQQRQQRRAKTSFQPQGVEAGLETRQLMTVNPGWTNGEWYLDVQVTTPLHYRSASVVGEAQSIEADADNFDETEGGGMSNSGDDGPELPPSKAPRGVERGMLFDGDSWQNWDSGAPVGDEAGLTTSRLMTRASGFVSDADNSDSDAEQDGDDSAGDDEDADSAAHNSSGDGLDDPLAKPGATSHGKELGMVKKEDALKHKDKAAHGKHGKPDSHHRAPSAGGVNLADLAL